MQRFEVENTHLRAATREERTATTEKWQRLWDTSRKARKASDRTRLLQGLSKWIPVGRRRVLLYLQTSLRRRRTQILPLLPLRQKFLPEILALETMWIAVVDYASRVILEFRRAEEARRGYPMAQTCRAPDSQSTPLDLTLDGGFVGWRGLKGGGYNR